MQKIQNERAIFRESRDKNIICAMFLGHPVLRRKLLIRFGSFLNVTMFTVQAMYIYNYKTNSKGLGLGLSLKKVDNFQFNLLKQALIPFSRIEIQRNVFRCFRGNLYLHLFQIADGLLASQNAKI